MEELTAFLGEVAFEGAGYPGFRGFGIEPDGFQGWDDGVDIRRESIALLQQHGSFDLPGYLDSRVISISGHCIAESAAQLRWYQAIFTSLLADGGAGRLVVKQRGESLWADVRLASKPTFRELRNSRGTRARFQLQLWAADPRKYGETRTFGPVAAGAELPVFHYGNFPAAPRFIVKAVGVPLDEGWAVYGPGSDPNRSRFKVNGTVPSGSSNLIDLSTGQVTVGGAVRVGVIEDATTWAIPGGPTVQHLLDTNDDGGTLTVSITDTFI